jgi:hypothetical protein
VDPTVTEVDGDISDITYIIDSGALIVQGLVPPNVYLPNSGVHTAALASNPDLLIEYGVVEMSTGKKPQWIKYDSAYRTMIIEETDEAKEGIYRMRVEAWFSYRP